MRNLTVISNAAWATLAMSGLLHAQYTGISTYDGPLPASDNLTVNWNFQADPENAPLVYDYWSDDALPTTTSLVQLPINNEAFNITLATNGPRTVYALNLGAPANSSMGARSWIVSGSVANSLSLTSQDSFSDAGTSRAMAIDVSATTTGSTSGSDRLRLTTPIVLGSGSEGPGIHYAYFSNTLADAALATENRITQAPGTTWGLVYAGNRRIEAKGGNYLSHGYSLSGGITVEDGAHVRFYNNFLQDNDGTSGDLNLNGAGQFRISQNSGQIVFNGIQGASSTSILTTQASNRDLVIGAGDGNGSYAGLVTGGINIYKVGNGQQVFSNEASTFNGNLVISEGAISFSTIANAGTASSLGNGNNNASGITFDGGKLVYTGAGSTSNRTFTIGLRGGTIEANGTGALVLGSTSFGAIATDTAFSTGRHSATASTTVAGMLAINGLSDLLPNLTVSSSNVTGLGGAQEITSLDANTGTMELTTGSVGAPGSGVGAPLFTFTSSAAVDRSLNLTGTSTANNTIAASLADSSLGKVGVVKSGTGKWILDNPQYMSGDVTVNAGTLVVDGDTVAAANITGNLTTNNAVVTGVSSTAGLVVGQPVTGVGIAVGASIRSIDTVNGTITLSHNATTTSTGTSLALEAGTGSGLGSVTVNDTGAFVNNKSHYVGGNAQAAGAASSLVVNTGGTATVTETLKVWGTGSVAVQGSLTVGNILSDGSVSITNDGLLTVSQSNPAPQGDDAKTSVLSSLSIANNGAVIDPATFREYSGTLDLVNNDLIVRGGLLTEIEDMIRAGRVELGGSGKGITSSESQFGIYAGVTTLGVIQNDDGFGNPIYTEWNGVSGLGIADILIKYTWYGDADLSGVVDDFDFALLDAGYTGAGTGWFYGDFDLNGSIDDVDFALLDAGFTGGGSNTHLPEPSLAVLGASLFAGVLRRRRVR